MNRQRQQDGSPGQLGLGISAQKALLENCDVEKRTIAAVAAAADADVDDAAAAVAKHDLALEKPSDRAVDHPETTSLSLWQIRQKECILTISENPYPLELGSRSAHS